VIDFFVYCLFMSIGMLVGAFAGWMFWNWWVGKKYEEWNPREHCE
jgi:hypothetical protein